MGRPEKATAVAELTEGFRSSTAVVLTEYRGLSVAQLKELRRTLGSQVTYAVVKNTLTKIAAREAQVEGIDTLLAGPSALAFVSGDPVEAAKGLRDFARANPLLVIKGGVMDGRTLTPDEIRTLADLESREVLLAKLAGAMKASLSGAVSLFAAPLAQTARLVEALRQKAEADPSVLAAGPGTPVAAVEAPAEPADIGTGTDTDTDTDTDEATTAPGDTAEATDPTDQVESRDPAEPAQTTEAADEAAEAIPTDEA
jgi:large subunit ribosomal protein L10